MNKFWKGKSGWIGGLFAAALLPLGQASVPAIPGTINYIEGQVTLEGQALTPKSAGSVNVAANQVLSTDKGRTEILLTPGVFIRLGDNSAVRMVSPGLTNTQVELLNGEAMVEATELLKDNNISLLDHDARIRLEKNGLYDFKAAPPEAAVYDGRAEVFADDQKVTLKKGKKIELTGVLQPEKFDTKSHDALYAWSNVRSQYLAQASLGSARTIVVNGGWWGPGWYWNPLWGMYSFVPNGFLYSPFGWGFYSPSIVYWGPAYVPGVRYRPIPVPGFRRSVVRPGVTAPAPHFGGGTVRGGSGHRR